jgi:tetratricopeptide (TPR) repeat protein
MADAASRIAELQGELGANPASRQFYQLGELLRRERRQKEAAEVLHAGLAHHPRYVAAWVALGRAYLETEAAEAAEAALEQAIGLDGQNPVAWRLLGEARLARGDRFAALDAMGRALELVPGDEVLQAAVEALASKTEPPRGQMPILTPIVRPAGVSSPAAAPPAVVAPPPPVTADPFGVEVLADVLPAPAEVFGEALNEGLVVGPPAELPLAPPAQDPAAAVAATASETPPAAAPTASAAAPTGEATAAGALEVEPPRAEAPPASTPAPASERASLEAIEAGLAPLEFVIEQPRPVPETPKLESAEPVHVAAIESASAPAEAVAAEPAAFVEAGAGAAALPPSPAPVAVAEERTEAPPTMTLARLYIQQRALDEAQGVLLRLVDREPENQEARDLLELVRDMMSPLPEALPALPPAERKIAALQRWLACFALAKERSQA